MIRILFLAANPTDQLRLHLRREFDQLRHALDATPHGRRFHLIQEFAVAADQLQELLVRHQPQIVHFSGHGSAEGLLFEAADGQSQRVAPATLRDLFAGFRQTVHCVLLNACYSQQHADAIATVIDSVVGMSDALTDEAALAFATAFYRALANNASLADAVALGRNQLDLQGLDEAHKPLLLPNRSVTGQLHALAWDDDAVTAATTSGATTTINSGGGTVIGHDLQVGAGDFINRDKVIIQQQTNIYQTVAAANQSVAGHDSVVFVPFPRKSATEFVGRDAELVELHEKLQQSQMVGVRPAAALTGLGGIGKTQLAVEYAYRYQASYPGGIFWINAADLNRVRSALVETAERMGLRTDYNTSDNALLAGLVKRCQQQPATLLCFDNAPDAVILWRRLTQELNTATLGAAILITTRRRELPPNMAALDLRRLSDDTVRWLLEKARPDLLPDPDLLRLLERLGGLPLVVSLVANALHNSPDATIADYLVALDHHGEEVVHEELDVHLGDYDLYRGFYTRTLLPVLREQWERLCQQPKSENAQLLLRIAGQLPEASEIPITRLGLLAGLADGRVIRPLASAIQILWKAALIEELKTDAIRLHPLVRDFATGLTPAADRANFCTVCAQRLDTAYADVERLGHEYFKRGIADLLVDLIIAIDLAQPTVSMLRSPVSSLQSLLRRLRLESNHLQGDAASRQPQRLWQQLLSRTASMADNSVSQHLRTLLQATFHWLPQWRHQHQSSAVEQTLVGHTGSVRDVAVINTKQIVSASSDHTLKVWNLVTGTVEQSLIGHENWVWAVAKLDINRIISASDDRTIKIWNLQTGTIEQTLTSHEATVRSVAVLTPYRIVSASDDHTLKVWNLENGTVEQTLVGHKASVRDVAVLNELRIVSGSDDCTIRIWNLLTGTVEQTLIGHKSWVLALAVLDVNRIVSASDDRTLKIWNLQTGTVEQTLTGHEDKVFNVAVLDDNHIISSGGGGTADRTLKIWDLRTGVVERTLRGHEDWVRSIAILDGQRVVSGSSDRTLKVWNLQAETVEQTLVGHKGSVLGLVVVDTQRIVSTSADCTIKVWNLQTGTIEQTLVGHKDWVRGVVVLDDQRIVSASSDHTLKIWNLQTGTVEQTLAGHNDWVRDVVMIDAQHVASASSDHTLKIWNLQTGMAEQTLVGHKDWVRSVVIVDDWRIVSASSDYTLKVWNLQTGMVEQTLVGHKDWVRSVAKLNKQSIVSASADHTLKIWNLQTGMAEQTLIGHEASVHDVAVLDDYHIVSASTDRTLKIWNLHTGQVLASIGLDGAPQCVAVARQDGRTLVVAGDAGGALYCLELMEPVAGN